MTASNAQLSTTFSVGKRFRVTMTADLPRPSRIDCRWSPDLPRRLKQRDIADYRRGRDAFFAELGAALGLRAVVAEPFPGGARISVPEAAQAEGRA